MGTIEIGKGAGRAEPDKQPPKGASPEARDQPQSAFTWEGTFKDPHLEELFRHDFWAKGFKPVRLTLIITAIATLAASVTDFLTLQISPAAIGLLMLRIVAAGTCILPLFLYKKPDHTTRLEYAIMCAEAAMFTLLVTATYFTSQGYLVSLTGTTAFIFAIYAFLPIRLVLTASVSILGSITQLTVLTASTSIADHEWGTLIFIFIAANALGIFAARALGELRRRDFLQTKELEDSRDSLQQAQSVYRTLLETSNAHAELLTPDGIRIAMNRWVSQVRGVNEDELIGKSVYEGLDDISAGHYRDSVTRVLQTKRTYRFNYEDNAQFFESIVHPVLNEMGEVTAVSVHTFDRTQDHKREAALKHAQVEALSAQRLAEQAQHAAESANMSKTRFLTNMSHELRTPLNAIIGFSEIIKTGMFGELNPKYKEYAEDIHDSGTYLLALISDILDIAQIEAGHAELKETHFVLDDTIDDVLRIIEPQARNRDIHNIERNLVEPPLVILADERAIKQVLINLLTNAVRYGASGGRLAISSSLDSEGISIRVTDWGPGIPKQDLERIMKPFEQVEIHADSSGVGLDLPLAKHLVESHEGTLTIESTVGQQTSVIMRLPLTRVRSALEAQHVN